MNEINPHGFPTLRDAIYPGFQQKRTVAVERWRAAFESPSHADEFLAAWSEAIAEHETRAQAHAAAIKADRMATERERLRTQAIPNAFVAAGAAPRDVRLWLSGQRRETEAFKAARDLLDTPGDRPFLVLSGTTGVGKTCGATLALLDHAAKQERWRSNDAPCFWNAAALGLGALLGKAAEEKLTQAVDAPVLVIEDLGAEPMVGADLWLSMLGVVIDSRYRDEALTIITTNLTMETLRKRYGERIADRLRQCARLKGCEKDSMRKAAP